MSKPSTGVLASVNDRRRETFHEAARGDASWFTLISGDVTPTASMSAGLMEIPPHGGVLQPHRHAHAEIYFVHEGAGLLTIEGEEKSITTGMTAFIPGDAEHSLRNDSSFVLRIFYVFPTDCFADVSYRFSKRD